MGTPDVGGIQREGDDGDCDENDAAARDESVDVGAQQQRRRRSMSSGGGTFHYAARGVWRCQGRRMGAKAIPAITKVVW